MGTQLSLPKRAQSPNFRPMSVVVRQMAGWIKMPIGMEVGLGLGDSVLDGDPAPPYHSSPKWGHNPQLSAHVYYVRPNGWMDQDATCYGGRHRPRQLCVRWGPSWAPLERAQALHPIFGPCLLWPNGWIDQHATWYGGRPRPRRRFVRWGPSSP